MEAPEGRDGHSTGSDRRSTLTQQQLALIVSIASDAIIAIDAAERIVFFNDGAEAIFGHAGTDILGQPLSILLPERFRSAHHTHVQTFAAAAENARPMGHRSQIYGLRSDGSEFPAEASIAKATDEAGVHYLVVLRDVTGRRAAEEAALALARESAARASAEAAGARMTLLAAASEELASSLDYETTLRTVARLCVPDVADWAAVDIVEGSSLRRLAVEHSDAAKIALVEQIQQRYPADPNAPHGVWNVVRTGSSELVAEISDALIESVAQDAEHRRLIRELGLRSYVAVPLVSRERVLGAITLVYAESGRRYSEPDLQFLEDLARRAATAIETAQLVTLLREAQDRLQEQAQELEVQAEELETQNLQLQHQASELRRISSAKSDFMATVSHELRTPLNAIIGYTELLRDGVPVAIPEPARQQVERIQLGAHHLLQLIEEILTFSSLEAGRQTARVQPVDTAGLLAELHAITEPLAERQGLTFAIRPRRIPSTLYTDPTKLRQILLNLLSNAVKFTDQGSVELEVDSDDSSATFIVRDTGIGVAPADQALLFEPFWQADQSLTRKAQGAGLGLAIAHRFAHLLGGDIVVRSQPGEGSEFTVRLPAVQPASADGASARDAAGY